MEWPDGRGSPLLHWEQVTALLGCRDTDSRVLGGSLYLISFLSLFLPTLWVTHGVLAAVPLLGLAQGIKKK